MKTAVSDIAVTEGAIKEAEIIVKEIAPALMGKDHIVIGLAISKLFGVWLASHNSDDVLSTRLYRAKLGIWLNSVAIKLADHIDKKELAAEQG